MASLPHGASGVDSPSKGQNACFLEGNLQDLQATVDLLCPRAHPPGGSGSGSAPERWPIGPFQVGFIDFVRLIGICSILKPLLLAPCCRQDLREAFVLYEVYLARLLWAFEMNANFRK